MKEEIISTAGAAAIKSAPPVTVAGALAAGITLDRLVVVLTIIPGGADCLSGLALAARMAPQGARMSRPGSTLPVRSLVAALALSAAGLIAIVDREDTPTPQWCPRAMTVQPMASARPFARMARR
jgi:hypothetical protein